jgi:hypothetical protein
MAIYYNNELVDVNSLEKYHTKQLLKILKISRIVEYNDKEDMCSESIKNKIKQILPTREHVPSKSESKRLRKERIKRGR